MKADKMSCIIYADIEFLIRIKNGCENNPENFSTTEIGDDIHCHFQNEQIANLIT